MNSEKRASKNIVSVYDITVYLKVPQKTVLGWIREGKLPFFYVPGRHPPIEVDALRKFIQAEKIEVPEGATLANQTYRVLIVEDDPDLLEILGSHLKDELPIEVCMVDHGFSAGLQIASWHPDLILLDYVMPGMNGFEVCDRLRQNEDTRDIPVLAITALASGGADSRKAVIESGVSDVLGKPFRSEELIKKVKALLGIIKTAPMPS